MMTEIRSEVDEFFQLLEKLYREAPKEASVERSQEKAWDRFSEVGLPTRKDDVFRYLKLRMLYRHAYENGQPKTVEASAIDPYVYPECQETLMVFVNGHFSPQLSRLKGLPDKIVISSLSGAMRPYGALLANQMAKSIKDEKDPFALLNLAMHGEGAFLYLPPRTHCKAPLQVLYLTDGGEAAGLTTPRLQLFVGASAEIELFSTHAHLSSGPVCINQRVDITLEENAHVRYVQANSHRSAMVWHLDALRATLKKASTLKSICVSNGSEAVRNDYSIALAGEGSEVQLNGIWLLKERREMHHHIFIDHQAPNCLSRQLFKGALYDQSHSSFEGKIMVRQAAQETNAFQLNNNLLLSDGASAESKPNLEIFADNVKASHGATMGQLEKEELFYLQSRGFTLPEAQKLLVKGFCQEIIHMISQPSLRKLVGEYVTES
jgi:Fe-S cluster assembly protein SufD